MIRARAKENSEASIEMTPLIDMVFLLLIFFMVSTTFVKDSKLDIERPGASTATAASTRSLRVSIDRSGTITMDNVPVRPWMVQSRVREGLASGADGNVLVVSDRRVPAETLIEVVDQCRLAGAVSVGVVTDLEHASVGG